MEEGVEDSQAVRPGHTERRNTPFAGGSDDSGDGVIAAAELFFSRSMGETYAVCTSGFFGFLYTSQSSREKTEKQIQ